MRALWAPLAALALLAAAPSPSPSPAASPATLRATVVCQYAPFYYFNGNIAQRADTPGARAGMVFEVRSSRTTLNSIDYVETNVAAVGPNFGGEHLWLWKGCVSVQ